MSIFKKIYRLFRPEKPKGMKYDVAMSLVEELYDVRRHIWNADTYVEYKGGQFWKWSRLAGWNHYSPTKADMWADDWEVVK